MVLNFSFIVGGQSALSRRAGITVTTLNHISGARAGVAGVYNQYQYLPEKTAALARWADHISALIKGRAAKIVPIKRKA